jgi:uncharacterized protein YcbK (DUF882 family)
MENSTKLTPKKTTGKPSPIIVTRNLQNIKLTPNIWLWECIEASKKNLESELVELSYKFLNDNFDLIMPNAYKVAQEVQIIRDYYKVPVVITCGLRTAEWNRKQGRNYPSKHETFEALDFYLQGKDLRQVYNFVNLNFKQGGRGLYLRNNFIHKDIGPYDIWGDK